RRISEDFELWLRMAERWRLGYIDQPLVAYRHRPGSASEDKILTGKAALEVIDAFWRSRPDYRQVRRVLWRHSLAGHLSALGAAASDKGQRAVALRHLVRSLRYRPGRLTTWKYLLGTLMPFLRGRRIGPSAGDDVMGAA